MGPTLPLAEVPLAVLLWWTPARRLAQAQWLPQAQRLAQARQLAQVLLTELALQMALAHPSLRVLQKEQTPVPVRSRAQSLLAGRDRLAG